MAVLFIAVMATALVQEVPHEYLGIAVFVAIVVHIVLNRRWFKALFHGRYNAVRILQLVAVIGLATCIVGQMASSLVLSKYVLDFLPALPGASWARRVHMLCSYWSFVFAFMHVGLQLKGFRRLALSEGTAMPAVGAWLIRIAIVLIVCYGLYSFAQMDMGAYLLGQVEFAAADYSKPIALAIAQYASIAALVAGLFHYIRCIIEAMRYKA